jgi:CheY-like chemotaxis protein
MNKKRILIIDDEASITRSVRLNLEALGTYEVRQENVATAAVQSAREFKPDLILLDVMMPGMDGGEVAAKLRESPWMRDIPIIFLTAIVSNAETHGNEAAIGGQVYLAKPVNLDTLTHAIEQHLNKHA